MAEINTFSRYCRHHGRHHNHNHQCNVITFILLREQYVRALGAVSVPEKMQRVTAARVTAAVL